MLKITLNPDKEQTLIIKSYIDAYRFTYNKSLESIINTYENGKFQLYDIEKLIKENKFLEEIDYMTLIFSQKEAMYAFNKKLKFEIKKYKSSNNVEIDFNNIYKYIDVKKLKYKFRSKNDVLKYCIIPNIFDDIRIEPNGFSCPLIPSMVVFNEDISYDREKKVNRVEIQRQGDVYSLILHYDKNIDKEMNDYIDIANKKTIGISRSIEDFASLSDSSRVRYDDSLKSIRKKFYRENIRVKNKIYGSLGSKKNIEDNLKFQNRKKILENISIKFEDKYRKYIEDVSDELVSRYDEIYVEDLTGYSEYNEEYIKNTKKYIGTEVDVATIKENKKNKIKTNDIENYIEDLFWKLFLIRLEQKTWSKNTGSIIRVEIDPIEGIELNEFQRYQIGKAKGGKRGQIFNREQKIEKRLRSEREHKHFSNPARARKIIYLGKAGRK